MLIWQVEKAKDQLLSEFSRSHPTLHLGPVHASFPHILASIQPQARFFSLKPSSVCISECSPYCNSLNTIISLIIGALLAGAANPGSLK